VPAQLLARRCLITGAGEEVEPLSARPPGAVLVLPSSEQLSTARVYAAFDVSGAGRSDAELAELAARVREAEDAGGLTVGLRHNDLAAAAIDACPSIAAALEDARAAGADLAMVSGSGPTVVGFFEGSDGAQRAHAARDRLRSRHPRAQVAERVDERFASPRLL
jgi:4-diphosphocytidyl-2-C-methyl-D-erythritol kinase